MDTNRKQRQPSGKTNKEKERRQREPDESQRSGQTGTLEDHREVDEENREISRLEEESGISDDDDDQENDEPSEESSRKRSSGEGRQKK
ncbi:MAG TPA: hypothetical protein VMG59_11875 [Phycisphaerae bacterium]|nr:hypothetical protein [Phycisphaerae bacterium]